MANYFIDTEFLEGTQTKRFLGIPFGQTKPTIDLISIALVSEDNREYYAISKDFNLYEAWNRYDKKPNMNYKPNFGGGSDGHYNPQFIKEYWIRENVLKPIYKELHDKENLYARQALYRANVYIKETEFNFTYSNLKKLIKKYGKSNKQIAEEVKDFVSYKNDWYDKDKGSLKVNFTIPELKDYDSRIEALNERNKLPQFYGYYSAYDHVALCWLFGKMIDLPDGFPMYTIDLQQELERIALLKTNEGFASIKERVKIIEEHPNYPKHTNEHNALADARWNKELYEFLKNI